MTSSPNPQSSPRTQRALLELLGLSVTSGLVFLLINFIHFQTLVVKVILYACMWDAVLAVGLVFGAYWIFWRRRSSLLVSEVALVGLSSFLFMALYAVLGPTVIDRSLSLYIVEKLDQRGGEISEDAMGDVFTREYLPEFRLVDVRLTEQVTSGTAVIEDGCIKLTAQGKNLAAFVRFYRRTFLPRKRYLRGEVTDQLTKPFEEPMSIVETRCTP